MTKVKILPPEMEMVEHSPPLKYLDYAAYFDAIISNKASFVDTKLSALKPSQKNHLVNTQFDLESVDCPLFHKEIGQGEVAIVLPLHLAVTNQSLDVARVLIKHGANVRQVDKKGNNVLHACVISSVYTPEMEQDMCATLHEFVIGLDPGVLVELLSVENNEQFRPIEYATQQETLHIMLQLLEEGESHFVARTEHLGMTTFKWFEVTEYENERHFRSPVALLAYLSRDKATDMTESFLKCPIFGAWIRAKFRLNIIPIIIWFLLRLVFLSSYFIWDRADVYFVQLEELLPANVTLCFDDVVHMSRGQFLGVGGFLVIFSIISLAGDIIELIHLMVTKGYRKMCTLQGWKDMLVKLYFYRVCQAIVCLSILTINGVAMRYPRIEDISDGVYLTVSICRIMVPLCACWSIMFFLQMAPLLGKSIVAIQGMLLDMANFLIIWALILFPFVHAFQIFVNYNSNQGCIEDFKNSFSTLYALFRMMLNMLDVTQYDMRFIEMLEVMHMVYVFMVAVILINFLIAIMSASAARIEEQQLVIEWLNSLYIAVTLQDKFGGWILKPYYNFMKKRVFASDSDGRLYIVTHSNRRQQLKESNSEFKT